MQMLRILVLAIAWAVAATAAAESPSPMRSCLECHRADRTDAELPLLEGQHADYLATQLRRFRDAHREGFPMESVAQALESDEIEALARELAAQPWTAHPSARDFEVIQAGRRRAAHLQCANCHLPGYSGTSTIPRLAGQNPEYLARQLRAFGDGRRYHPPSGVGSRMYTLSRDDIHALSHYLASRGAGPDLDWLAGRWCSVDGTRSTEEVWLREHGGLLLGVHRDVVDGKARFFEFLRIEIDGAAAHYLGQPQGAPSVAFALVDVGPEYAVFTNPAHDFPRRIRYERRDDALIATVDDGEGGNPQTWTWQRDCGLK